MIEKLLPEDFRTGDDLHKISDKINEITEAVNKLEKETIKAVGNSDVPLCKMCLLPEIMHTTIKASTHSEHNFVA